MALIETESWISQYWDKVKENYPSIDFSHFTFICKTPFRYIRQQMAKTHLPTICIKYLGKLKVFSASIHKLMRINEANKANGSISEEDYSIRKDRYMRDLDRSSVKSNVKRKNKT